MSEETTKVSDNESETAQPKPVKQPKKSSLHLYLIIILVLGAAAWTFWTYSPFMTQVKEQWFSRIIATPTVEQNAPQPESINPIPETELAQEDTIEPVVEDNIEQAPLFEPTPNMVPETNGLADSQAQIQADNMEELRLSMQASMQQLQQQVTTLQQNISQMHDQQQQQAQQYVRAQLFTALQQAASPLSNIEQMSAAWKSISFMPLLSEDKRNSAEQAFSMLTTMLLDKKNVSDEISSWVLTLSQQLKPDDLADVAPAIEGGADQVQQVATLDTGLDWLKQQFRISKVSELAIEVGDDPYQDIKLLMTNLHNLKQELINMHLTSIDLDNLFHQLAQHGIETDLSPAVLLGFEETQQALKNQASEWMEQL